jgi:hypothetical protein
MLWVYHVQALKIFYGFVGNMYLPDKAMLWIRDELSSPNQVLFERNVKQVWGAILNFFGES